MSLSSRWIHVLTSLELVMGRCKSLNIEERDLKLFKEKKKREDVQETSMFTIWKARNFEEQESLIITKGIEGEIAE